MNVAAGLVGRSGRLADVFEPAAGATIAEQVAGHVVVGDGEADVARTSQSANATASRCRGGCRRPRRAVDVAECRAGFVVVQTPLTGL
jgi:hypothetical protein